MQRITTLADMRPQEQQLQMERLPPPTYEACEHFVARMQLGGLEWGDITHAMLGLQKASIYEGWEDWHDRWTDFGRTYEVRAEEAERHGARVTQRQHLLKATACYHYGQFMYFDNEEKKARSRQKVTDLFHQALPYLDHEVRRLSIPYKDLLLPAYFIPAPGPGPSPCVILVNALESSSEVEMYSFAKEFHARGCSVLMFDGPGQGLLSKDHPLDPRFERVFESVLNTVGQIREIDPDRLGLCGASFGGHLVSRLAGLFPREIKAVINISGGFDHDAFLDMNIMVRKDFRHVFHQSSDEDMARLARESLHLRDIPGMTAKLLMVVSQKDIIIPYESSMRLLEWARGDKALISYPGTRHVCTSYFSDYIPRMTDWMADALTPSRH
jgi:pimeloyl-ACP methyl ester carboxylesterase